MKTQQETIVAIATSPGKGGVGIVRLSGARALEIAQKIFLPMPTKTKATASSNPTANQEWISHHMKYGHILDPDTQEIIDDVLTAWMQGPHTYTGEDVVEIQAHGNPVLLERIVMVCVRLGARLARAGEFTQRAFLNGRIDLVQAEAVAELIHAESIAEAKVARKRLSGHVSKELEHLYENMISILAECEADVDFPDENLPIAQRPEMMRRISQTTTLAKDLVRSYASNKKLHDGFAVAFVGAPNAGKSSLFNALLQEARAIVTPIAGTTRDTLREELELAGRKIRLVDTAGIRSNVHGDEIEKIGIERSKQALAQADLVCLVISTVAEDNHEHEGDLFTQQITEGVPDDKLWVIWNKVDLALPKSTQTLRRAAKHMQVSAKTGEGVEALKTALEAMLMEQAPVAESGGIANDRQRNLLEEFLVLLDKGVEAWQREESSEFVAFDLRQALGKIGEILGKDDHQEKILDEIFSKFCVGK